jgi:quinol monooxygenase YgiN
MIVVKITLNAQVQTLLSLIEPVGKEQGCKNYHIFCDIHDKNTQTC